MKKLTSQQKFYIGLVVILVALVLVYPYISDIGEFAKGSTRVAASKPGSVVLPVAPNICTDSDNGKIYDKFGVTVMNQSGTITTWTDECVTDTILNEIYCQADYGEGDWVGNIEYNCPNGCYQGHCTPVVTYGGIVDMLNACVNTPILIYNNPEGQQLANDLDINNDGSLTGNEVCGFWKYKYNIEKTCILSQAVDVDAIKYEAELVGNCQSTLYSIAGTKKIVAICCGTP